MRSLSNVVKGRKAIDVVQMYQFFSDFALEEEKEEEAPETEEEEAEAEDSGLEDEIARIREEEAREREKTSEILAEARREAEAILEDARKQAELLREEAFTKGHEEGFQAGTEEARQECETRYEEEVEDFRRHAAEFMDSIRQEKSALMEKYLEGEDLDVAEIKKVIRAATLANQMVPVTCGTSYKNKGVQNLLDAIVDYMPAPTDIAAIKGINPDTEEEEARPSSDDAPFAALAFKIMTDPYVGKLGFFRVYSGTLTAGSTVYNPDKDVDERIGRILMMHANNRTDIAQVYAGDIAAARVVATTRLVAIAGVIAARVVTTRIIAAARIIPAARLIPAARIVAAARPVSAAAARGPAAASV